MKCKVSYEKVWWYALNENKPSKEYMKDFLQNMVDRDLNIQYIDLDNVIITTKDINITYISFQHMDKTYYYIVKGINKLINKGWVLECELDIWNTYTLNYIEGLKENNSIVLCNRSHLFDKSSIQFNDSLLNSLPYKIKERKSIKKYFKWYNNKYISDNNLYALDDTIQNANICYVFNDANDNENSYFFVPLIENNKIYKVKSNNNDNILNLHLDMVIDFDKVGDERFRYNIEDKNNEIQEMFNKYNMVRISYNTIINNINNKTFLYSTDNFNTTDLVFKTVQVSAPVAYYIPVKMNVSSLTTFLSEDIWAYFEDLPNSSSYKSYNTFIELEFYGEKEINYSTYDFEEKTIKNSYNDIINLINSSEYSNKFLGCFLIPNILLLGNYINIEDNNTVSLKISYKLNNFYFKIGEWFNISEDKYIFNNITVSNINIFKYIKMYYYDNELNIPYLINDENEIEIKGVFNFTNVFNIFYNTKYDRLVNNILYLPDMLPSATNQYKKYVDATRNSVNTSYQIQKQNIYKENAMSLIGGVVDVATSFIPLVGNMKMMKEVSSMTLPANSWLFPTGLQNETQIDFVSKNFINNNSINNYNKAAGGIGGGITNIASSITNMIMKPKQLEKEIRANYADKNNSLGNKINLSLATNTSWLKDFSEKGQYECIEFLIPSDETLMLMNNMIYLYGEYNVWYKNINELWVDFNGFRYLDLDKNFLLINTIHLIDAPRQYYDKIINELNGVRIIDSAIGFKNATQN